MEAAEREGRGGSTPDGRRGRPPLPPPLAPGERYILRLDQVSTLSIMLFQLLNIANHWGQLQAQHARFYTLLVLAAAAVGAASTLLLPPRFYLRHRTLLVPAQRVLLLLSPSIRQTGVGTSLLLERQPREGAGGALRQLLHVLSATKLVLAITQRLALALPPIETAVLQAVLVMLTWNPAAYCATPMMRQPLTVSRMRHLAAALDWASLPMLATQSILAGPGLSVVVKEAGEDALCNKCLNFAAIGLAFVLPVLFSAFQAAQLACQQQQGTASTEMLASPQHASGLQRLLSRAAAAVRAANRGIGRALGTRAFRLQRPLLVWWALGFSWEVSKALAGKPAAKR